MAQKKVTLQDIADRIGVSRVTVYRALNNKEGMSDEVKQRIVLTASEMGYQFNYVASSLKRKPIKLAVIMYDEADEGKYYVKYVWDGYRQAKKEVAEFNVEFQEYHVKNSEEFETCLSSFLDRQNHEIDGIMITHLVNERVDRVLQRFADLGIGVVVLENICSEVSKVCVVRPDEEMAGAMAGELMVCCAGKQGKVLLAEGTAKTRDMNYAGSLCNLNSFESYLKEWAPQCRMVRLSGHGSELYEQAARWLEDEPNVIGMYSPNARNTIPFANALKNVGRQEKVVMIGSEVFTETIQMIQEGILRAIIYKNPYDQGYKGFKRLFESVVKKETAPSNEIITAVPQIVLKSNISCYLQ